MKNEKHFRCESTAIDAIVTIQHSHTWSCCFVVVTFIAFFFRRTTFVDLFGIVKNPTSIWRIYWNVHAYRFYTHHKCIYLPKKMHSNDSARSSPTAQKYIYKKIPFKLLNSWWSLTEMPIRLKCEIFHLISRFYWFMQWNWWPFRFGNTIFYYLSEA